VERLARLVALAVRRLLSRLPGAANCCIRSSLCDKGIRLGRGEAASPARPAAQRIRRLAADSLAQPTLGTLDGLLECELFLLAKLLLPELGLSQVLERPFIFLVIDVVHSIAQQVAGATGCRHADDRITHGT
jgi:hypothetical protein